MTALAAEAKPWAMPAVTGSSGTSADAEVLRRRLVRLAFDVHDGPMQSLVAVGYAVRELQSRLDESGKLERDAVGISLQEMVAELGSAEATLRTLIALIERGRPEIETLTEIVEAEVTRFRRRSAASVTVEAPNAFQPDSHSQSLAIGAVLREALTNIAKHAQAATVQVRVYAGSEGILLEIEDDGVGFDPAQVREGALGLNGMRERVALLGGTLTVLTRPGGPTVVSAELARWQNASGER